MPYISQLDRQIVAQLIAEAWHHKEDLRTGGPGMLNYVISCIIKYYLPENPSYKDYNDVLGVLSAVSHELYRVRIADYEDEKREANGEVF